MNIIQSPRRVAPARRKQCAILSILCFFCLRALYLRRHHNTSGRVADRLESCALTLKQFYDESQDDRHRAVRTASRPPFWISLLSGNLAQSDAAFRTRRFPENELDLLLRRALEVAPGNGIIIDGGANIGFVSLTAASLGFRVKAFEPVGLHIQKLSTSICLNAYDKIELIGKGLSDRPTILRPVNYAEATQLRNISWEDCVKRNRHSHLRKDAESDEGNCGETFEITTLDESLTTEDIQNVYFLKLDIEGHEVKAFAGASNLLKSKSLKYIHFEWCPSMIRSIGSDPMDAFSILDTNGFACRFEKDAVSGTDSAVIEPAAGAVQLDDGQVKENFLCVRKS